MSGSPRKGWCPTALRPMQTGDGLLVRLRPLGGVLTLDQAAAIAGCAAAFGNGHLDLTSRAKLQIRGVREQTLPGLVEILREAGLVGADEEATGLDIVSSPLAGLDPSERIDVQPVVAALDAKSKHDPALRALPAKFGFVIDGGGQLPLADIGADVRFVAIGPDAFEVRLADSPVGVCMSGAVLDVAAALAARFLELRGDDHRMRQVVERVGAEAFMSNAERGPLLTLRGRRWPGAVGSDEGGPTGRILSVPAGRDGARLHRPHPILADARATFSPVLARDLAGEGVRAQLLGVHELGYVGIVAAFGRLEASNLATLVSLAKKHSAHDLRLTPWRALLVTGLAPAFAHSLAAALDTTRFILDPGDPRLAVAACPGAPACPSGTTSTRADAAALAPLIPADADAIALHVSGCAKGCAHAGRAPITLVAYAGRYNLIRNGNAQSPPLASGLTLHAAAAMLTAPISEGGAAA